MLAVNRGDQRFELGVAEGHRTMIAKHRHPRLRSAPLEDRAETQVEARGGSAAPCQYPAVRKFC